VTPIDRHRVLRAMSPNVWDFANRVLYDLCRDYPAHADAQVVLAKVNLIGRVYAASIERKRPRANDETSDRFYRRTVAPLIIRSGIDRWLYKVHQTEPGTPEALAAVVEVHGLTTSLFKRISTLEKRSLASKYLHFHRPRHFFIYDSRAVEAMRAYSSLLPRSSRSSHVGDNEYRKFAEKCTRLTAFCQREFGLSPLPRHIDNLLLGFNESET